MMMVIVVDRLVTNTEYCLWDGLGTHMKFKLLPHLCGSILTITRSEKLLKKTPIKDSWEVRTLRCKSQQQLHLATTYSTLQITTYRLTCVQFGSIVFSEESL